jgi:hypothetical protein
MVLAGRQALADVVVHWLLRLLISHKRRCFGPVTPRGLRAGLGLASVLRFILCRTGQGFKNIRETIWSPPKSQSAARLACRRR